MSFSMRVKEELAGKIGTARHCQIAEIAAALSLAGQVLAREDGGFEIYFCTDNRPLASAFFYLIRRCFSTTCEIRMQTANGRISWVLAIRDPESSLKILKASRFGEIEDVRGGSIEQEGLSVDPVLVKNVCCKRAFLRGAFLSSGSLTDPRTVRSYHLEIVCLDERMAKLIKSLFKDFGIDAKITERRNNFIVYLKDGDEICEALNIMGAAVSMMELENARIGREVRAKVNRTVNCETANIEKTVTAADRQTRDIQYIDETMGLKSLPDGLKQMARLRVEYPDDTLAELGERADPPVGKSGVNHRLRRLAEIAQKLRKEKEGKQ